METHPDALTRRWLREKCQLAHDCTLAHPYSIWTTLGATRISQALKTSDTLISFNSQLVKSETFKEETLQGIMGESRTAGEQGFKKKALEGASLADGSFLKSFKGLTRFRISLLRSRQDDKLKKADNVWVLKQQAVVDWSTHKGLI